MEDIKTLRSFLGLLNYARPYWKNIEKISGSLYNKTSATWQRYFNKKNIDLVKQIKAMIIENGCESEWEWALFRKTYKYDPKASESLCRYASEKYKEKGHLTSLDYKILVVIYCLDFFILFICSKQEITIRTNWEAIVKYG